MDGPTVPHIESAPAHHPSPPNSQCAQADHGARVVGGDQPCLDAAHDRDGHPAQSERQQQRDDGGEAGGETQTKQAGRTHGKAEHGGAAL